MNPAIAHRASWPILALVLLLIGTPASPADEFVLEVIPLHHALVDDVLPTLRELVAPGDQHRHGEGGLARHRRSHCRNADRPGHQLRYLASLGSGSDLPHSG